MAIDQQIEQEIQAKGLTAPRITPADIENAIYREFYFTAKEGSGIAGFGAEIDDPMATQALGLLTFCVLVLRNGFTVTGESACASPENFDAEVGRKIARQNAANKIWPLMGYELRSRLARGDINTGADVQLAWHGQLRDDLLDVLRISDPGSIVAHVKKLRGDSERLAGLEL